MPLLDLRPMHDEVARDLDTAWQRVLASNSFVGGIEVAEFERDWALYCGTRHAVGVANGTDAIALTLRALGIGRGDEVIVPANTFVGTVEAVIMAGARPRFVDVDPDTLLITASTVESGLTCRTAAVIPVHLYGNTVDMDAIGRLAERIGIAVVEDAAQAHGAAWHGARAGSLGTAGCFSFYPGKNLGALGDGGAVVSDDPDLIDRIRTLANHGRGSAGWHHHEAVGTNSRLDALQAAFLLTKLGRLDDWNASRRQIARLYRKLLPSEGCRLVTALPECESVHHLLVARFANRDRVRSVLRSKGIETGVHYPVPCHLQEPYLPFADGSFPVSERAATEILSLPLFPYMESDQLERVSIAVHEAVGGRAAHVAV